LFRAIALSLQEQRSNSAPPYQRLSSTPVQSGCDEGECVKSGTQTASDASNEDTVASSSSRSQPQALANTVSTSTFLSERAQLEKARLERLKRLRPDDNRNDSGGEPPRKRQSISPAVPQSGASSSSTSGLANGAQSSQEDDLYWDGELRQTANKYVDSGKNGENGRPVWRLSEIIGDVSETVSLGSKSPLTPPAPPARALRNQKSLLSSSRPLRYNGLGYTSFSCLRLPLWL